MTTPGSPGGSPLRIGGFALIGVGIVAGVIGLATAAIGGNGSSDPAAAGPTTTVSSTVEPGPVTPGPSGGEVPVPSFGPTGNIAAPTATTAPAAPGADSGVNQSGVGSGSLAEGGPAASVGSAPVRVYNNGTVTGLAARAASEFESAGWTVTEVKSYSDGIIPTSTVYYRPGTSEQAAADALASQFGMRSEPRFAGIEDATPGIIVIVTNDYQHR